MQPLDERRLARAARATASSAEHATVGGSAFEKSCGRERWKSMSQTSSLRRDVAAGRAAERLAERAGDHVDLAEHAEVLGDAAAGLAHHAGAVRVVDDDDGVVLARELEDVGQPRQVALHREDAVRDRRACAGPARSDSSPARSSSMSEWL